MFKASPFPEFSSSREIIRDRIEDSKDTALSQLLKGLEEMERELDQAAELNVPGLKESAE